LRVFLNTFSAFIKCNPSLFTCIHRSLTPTDRYNNKFDASSEAQQGSWPSTATPSFVSFTSWRQTMTRISLVAASLLLVLSACGHTTGDRALSGAGIGAGVGVVGGALLGAPVEGALIGGAVGAGAGALTSSNQINLGKPIWK
jgi:osmotically inducible lipoprotein OsmB